MFNELMNILSFPLLNVKPLKLTFKAVVPVLLTLKLGLSVVPEPVVALIWLSTILNPGSALALKADNITIKNINIEDMVFFICYDTPLFAVAVEGNLELRSLVGIFILTNSDIIAE